MREVGKPDLSGLTAAGRKIHYYYYYNQSGTLNLSTSPFGMLNLNALLKLRLTIHRTTAQPHLSFANIYPQQHQTGELTYINPSAEPYYAEKIDALRQNFPETSINHTSYTALRGHPTTVSLETKRSGNDFDGAVLQTAVWQAGHWKMLRSFLQKTIRDRSAEATSGSTQGVFVESEDTEQYVETSLRKLGALHGIYSQGHEWYYVATSPEIVDQQGKPSLRTILWLHEPIGRTNSALVIAFAGHFDNRLKQIIGRYIMVTFNSDVGREVRTNHARDTWYQDKPRFFQVQYKAPCRTACRGTPPRVLTAERFQYLEGRLRKDWLHVMGSAIEEAPEDERNRACRPDVHARNRRDTDVAASLARSIGGSLFQDGSGRTTLAGASSAMREDFAAVLRARSLYTRRLRSIPRDAPPSGVTFASPATSASPDALPPELNLALRMNRRDTTMADSHGDIWVQLATAASGRPGNFRGTVDEMKEQMLDALRLSSDTGFPLSRLVAIWRNERWRHMTTRWCETTVGRATFQISTWDWMICNRIDDFWFMAFRQVLYTLAQLPSNAAKLVSSEDWKKMSASLGAERTQEQVQELFYPGQSGKPLNAASKRNRKLLQSFHDGEYWDIYDRVLHTPALRFPDIHRITGMSQGQGRVLFRVMDHVVNWLNPNRTIAVDRRSNTKPQLRLDLEQKLDYYTLTRLRQAEKRVKIFHASATPQLPRVSASVLLQQEVLEFVLEHLAAFNAPKVRGYLNDGDPDSDLYAARFREHTWAGVLKIVRWHVGSDFRPEWLLVEGSDDKPPEAEPSTQAANLTLRRWRAHGA
ncbi:6-hydroxy-D-nicotine oxidase [Purpureocillium lavendulum]|uniref:6-hydroxy-D-nicotine oxidase n=1 Tax=Purpureocillium lavendulum TaxID=1247861 RepID=A0AB34FE81_9HYPO|nr:6-hydroxy-D-nicotine oxidase [Purpureocillium lavendulum]